MSDPSGKARQSVWSLIEVHPELNDRRNLGEVLLRHRLYVPGDSNRMWCYDWKGMLREVRAALPGRLRGVLYCDRFHRANPGSASCEGV